MSSSRVQLACVQTCTLVNMGGNCELNWKVKEKWQETIGSFVKVNVGVVCDRRVSSVTAFYMRAYIEVCLYISCARRLCFCDSRLPGILNSVRIARQTVLCKSVYLCAFCQFHYFASLSAHSRRRYLRVSSSTVDKYHQAVARAWPCLTKAPSDEVRTRIDCGSDSELGGWGGLRGPHKPLVSQIPLRRKPPIQSRQIRWSRLCE